MDTTDVRMPQTVANSLVVLMGLNVFIKLEKCLAIARVFFQPVRILCSLFNN